MSEAKIILEHHVPDDWIDYNGHMNDADYVRAFSWGVDRFMDLIGLTDVFRKAQQYTMYTLENHVCYLDEMKHLEAFDVRLWILDYDSKRVHAFFELYGEDGKRAATSEQMLMGIDQTSGRPAPFADRIWNVIEILAARHTPVEQPKETGRVIGIKRK